jgi:hypothetical protein
MKRTFVVAMAAVLGVAAAMAGAAAGASPDCDTASRDLERAQQALSRAVRESDTTAAAYAVCKERAQSCLPQKAAYDAASVAKSKALAGLRAAQAKQQAACR